jgi:hypothetical protein
VYEYVVYVYVVYEYVVYEYAVYDYVVYEAVRVSYRSIVPTPPLLVDGIQVHKVMTVSQSK